MNLRQEEELYIGQKRQVTDLQRCQIVDVWAYNFKQEMQRFLEVAQHFNIIAVDTEFPGVCINSNNFINKGLTQQQYQYQLLVQNIHHSKLIQVGFAICNGDAHSPFPTCVWQFNLKFNIDEDSFASESISFLQTHGFDFERLKNEGIDHMDFAEYFEASGLVYDPQVTWIAFHGEYDFPYLLHLLKNEPLPETIDEFYKDLKLYFRTIYDLKLIIYDKERVSGLGLDDFSQQLALRRIGPSHQAGSDSLLTLACFVRMRQAFDIFQHTTFTFYSNLIFGVGRGFVPYKRKSNHKMEEPMVFRSEQFKSLCKQMMHHYPHFHFEPFPPCLMRKNQPQSQVYQAYSQYGTYQQYPYQFGYSYMPNSQLYYQNQGYHHQYNNNHYQSRHSKRRY